MPRSFVTFLFDNGSLRASSTLNLRALAEQMGKRGCPVRAVSLLHSSGVDPTELGGLRAELLEVAVGEALAARPELEVRLLPFFLGPSGALTDYVPQRMRSIASKFPKASFKMAPSLCADPSAPDPELVEALVGTTLRAIEKSGFQRPRVVLVDHGTPVPMVTQVRDSLGCALAARLQGRAGDVAVASMERRPGEAYAFNEPLLETRLTTPPFDIGEVVVVLQFLSPGRHAGPEGDVAQICKAACGRSRGLRIEISDTMGAEPPMLDLLVRRWNELAISAPQAWA
ncbi:MAG: cobalamin biosynthesis protein CbiX [Opitutaceae bacterium]|nr:cobalamin biosynthesis protein CbiX [Opitutaceae bacterium]